jgi:membrane protease YdiL (CAAX protease family)
VTHLVETAGLAASDPASPPRRATWGVIASILWVVVAFEIVGRAVDYLFALPPVKAFEAGSAAWHAVNLLTAWSVQLLVIIVAVRLARWPVAEYLGWVRPRAKHVWFGIAVVLAWQLAQSGLAYLAAGQAFDVAGYRAAVAAGTSPWWYVLQWWPAIICAPIVEESAVRGFMWRGIESRAGRLAAFLVTSLFFAAIHFRYFFKWDTGQVFLGTFGLYVIAGLLYGWLRWRSGNTTATIIPHAVDNLYIQFSAVIASAFVA